MQIRLKVFDLVRKLEVMEQRRYTTTEIAKALGVTRNTVNDLLENRSKAIYFETLVGLVGFFRERGLEVGIADILVLEDSAKE